MLSNVITGTTPLQATLLCVGSEREERGSWKPDSSMHYSTSANQSLKN